MRFFGLVLRRDGLYTKRMSKIPRVYSQRRRTLYFVFFAVLFILLIPVVVLFADGYRLNKNWKLVSTGGISLSGVPAGADVYVNYKKVSSSAFFEDTFYIQNLLPEDYFVVVAKDGDWSWAKHLVVNEKKVSSASVLILPSHPKLQPITELVPGENLTNNFHFFDSTTATSTLNPQYPIIADLFSTSSSDQINDGAVLKDNIKIWAAGKQIFAKWQGSPQAIPSFFCAVATSTSSSPACNPTASIYTFPTQIEKIDFFPNRDDVVLLETADGIYALEMDTRPEQNYQPVYLAKNLDFRVSGSALYIEEGGNFYQVEM